MEVAGQNNAELINADAREEASRLFYLGHYEAALQKIGTSRIEVNDLETQILLLNLIFLTEREQQLKAMIEKHIGKLDTLPLASLSSIVEIVAHFGTEEQLVEFLRLDELKSRAADWNTLAEGQVNGSPAQGNPARAQRLYRSLQLRDKVLPMMYVIFTENIATFPACQHRITKVCEQS
eukprot:TRINITY_DN3200_c0_g1_i2.p1 TRINITY_DN3200_c0_g1~~TRINITY_DN3200_c0_g1_i2.p1  ORF type:complete len:179 (-),score=34.32 TRINITY_DN3200_c0_g1_i2:318-854(-)